MRPYIYTQRDGIHIIDLEKSVLQVQKALKFVTDTIALGHKILFVGTKKQASEVIAEQAKRAGQFYVSNRWLGGTLTNFKTIKASIERLNSLYEKKEKGELQKLTKKEGLQIERTIEKLEHSLGGIKEMTRLPGALFLVDPGYEEIAKLEAMKLGIPVVAILDTNANPDNIDFPIVANDDAIRSIQLVTIALADACLKGVERYEHLAREQEKTQAENKAQKAKDSKVREQKVTSKAKAYTAKKPTDKEAELSPEDVEAYAKAKAEEDADAVK